MSTYKISATKANVHGFLSADIDPIISISSNDTLLLETLEPDWRISRPEKPSSDSGVFMLKGEMDIGQALSGPVFIQNAHPGQTLAVSIKDIVPGNWGWSRVGGDANSDHLKRLGLSSEEEYFLIWSIDKKNNVCISNQGHQVQLRPFMGNIALVPEGKDPVSNHIPGAHGGNIDCKALTAGSILYLPIMHEGALLSIGDGHACQGDGELGGTAIECPMQTIKLSFDILDYTIKYPVANTPSGWVTFGFDEDLTEASYIALRNMISLLQELYHFHYEEALAIISLTVDMRVTQIVNGIRGAHALLPHNSFSAVNTEQ